MKVRDSNFEQLWITDSFWRFWQLLVKKIFSSVQLNMKVNLHSTDAQLKNNKTQYLQIVFPISFCWCAYKTNYSVDHVLSHFELHTIPWQCGFTICSVDTLEMELCQSYFGKFSLRLHKTSRINIIVANDEHLPVLCRILRNGWRDSIKFIKLFHGSVGPVVIIFWRLN